MSEQKTIDLNYPTVIGGAVAAATAAALSTRLGLVGTIVGAAFASVVSTLVTAWLAGWIERLHHATRQVAEERRPTPLRGLVVGALAMGLVGVAFHSGLELATSDLPHDAFAARVLAELGVR